MKDSNVKQDEEELEEAFGSASQQFDLGGAAHPVAAEVWWRAPVKVKELCQRCRGEDSMLSKGVSDKMRNNLCKVRYPSAPGFQEYV